MATHAITFRMAQVSDYADRWASTVAAIKREAKDGITWEETTSFILLESSKSVHDLAMSIYVGSQFDGTKDKLLVIDLTNNAHATRGKIDYPNTLASFFLKSSVSRGLFTI